MSKSYLERLKEKTQQQKHYGGDAKETAASVGAVSCPNCGAARAKQDGLKVCAYCGHEFLSINLSDGLNIKKDDE